MGAARFARLVICTPQGWCAAAAATGRAPAMPCPHYYDHQHDAHGDCIGSTWTVAYCCASFSCSSILHALCMLSHEPSSCCNAAARSAPVHILDALFTCCALSCTAAWVMCAGCWQKLWQAAVHPVPTGHPALHPPPALPPPYLPQPHQHQNLAAAQQQLAWSASWLPPRQQQLCCDCLGPFLQVTVFL